MQLTILDILQTASHKNNPIVEYTSRTTGLVVRIYQVSDNLIVSLHVPRDNWKTLLQSTMFSSKTRIVYTSPETLSQQRYKVHTGFHEELGSVLPYIEAFFEKRHPSLRGIHFMGHSRAGALAILAGSRMATLYPKTLIHVVTTGSPPTGDLSFKKWYDRTENIYMDRIVIDKDVIPKFIGRTYVHMGTKWRLTSNRSFFSNFQYHHLRKTYVSFLAKECPLLPELRRSLPLSKFSLLLLLRSGKQQQC